MLGDKLSPGTKPGFLKSEKMLRLSQLNIFSDLRKPGLVPGKSLSPSIKIDSVKEKYSAYNMTNRMRSFHMKKESLFSYNIYYTAYVHIYSLVEYITAIKNNHWCW